MSGGAGDSTRARARRARPNARRRLPSPTWRYAPGPLPRGPQRAGRGPGPRAPAPRLRDHRRRQGRDDEPLRVAQRASVHRAGVQEGGPLLRLQLLPRRGLVPESLPARRPSGTRSPASTGAVPDRARRARPTSQHHWAPSGSPELPHARRLVATAQPGRSRLLAVPDVPREREEEPRVVRSTRSQPRRRACPRARPGSPTLVQQLADRLLVLSDARPLRRAGRALDALFPREQFHFLTLEQIAEDPQRAIDRVHGSLGCPARVRRPAPIARRAPMTRSRRGARAADRVFPSPQRAPVRAPRRRLRMGAGGQGAGYRPWHVAPAGPAGASAHDDGANCTKP